MALDILVNTGTSDNPLNFSGTEFTEIDINADELIFSAGLAGVVADGLPIPSDFQLNQAGVILTGIEQTVSKYFLSDNSAGILKQIHNMGSGNYRYVVACDFDAATGTEPTLEIWDDSDLDSVNDVCLGAGTPSSSWVCIKTDCGSLANSMTTCGWAPISSVAASGSGMGG